MIVALTTWNRPTYTRLLLDSMWVAREQLDEPLYVVAAAEPGCSEVLDVLATYNIVTAVNEERLGHVRNIMAAFEMGFEVADMQGEDFVMWLADDLVIAPDALECTAWMRDTFRSLETCVSTALHWQRSAPDPESYMAVGLRRNIHNSQGHGIWRRSWPWHRAAWEPVTSKLHRGQDPPGYRGNDQWISAHLRADNRCQAAPLLSRVYSTGVDDGADPAGMHATAASLAGDNPALYAGSLPRMPGPFHCASPEAMAKVLLEWANYERDFAAEWPGIRAAMGL